MTDQERTAVVQYEQRQVANMWGDDYPLIKQLFPSVKSIDLVLLFKTAQAMHLNPILKEIYALSTTNGTQIYIGKAGIARKLNEQGGFSVDYSRGFDPIAAEALTPRWGKLGGKGFYVDCIVEHRGLRVVARAYYDEYAPDREPKPGSSWFKYPMSMIEKVSFCKSGRHLLGINLPAPEEMGIEMEEDDADETVAGVTAKYVEHSAGATKPVTAPAPIPVVETKVEIEEYTEGVLKYRKGVDGKEVSFNGKWMPAGTQIGKELTQKIISLFKNEFEAKNHVKKHFQGSDSVSTLTYEEAVAVYEWKKNNKADPRWYKDKIEDTGKKKSTAQEITDRLKKLGLTGNGKSLVVKWAKEFNWPKPYTFDKKAVELLTEVCALLENGTYKLSNADDVTELDKMVSEAWK